LKKQEYFLTKTKEQKKQRYKKVASVSRYFLFQTELLVGEKFQLFPQTYL